MSLRFAMWGRHEGHSWILAWCRTRRHGWHSRGTVHASTRLAQPWHSTCLNTAGTAVAQYMPQHGWHSRGTVHASTRLAQPWHSTCFNTAGTAVAQYMPQHGWHSRGTVHASTRLAQPWHSTCLNTAGTAVAQYMPQHGWHSRGTSRIGRCATAVPAVLKRVALLNGTEASHASTPRTTSPCTSVSR